MLASRMQADEPPFINMTPMVDVILCLLVFFMAATRLYDWDESEFAVNVPEVSDAAPATAAPDDLVLTVIKRGVVCGSRHELQPRSAHGIAERGAGAIRQPGGRDPRRRESHPIRTWPTSCRRAMKQVSGMSGFRSGLEMNDRNRQ